MRKFRDLERENVPVVSLFNGLSDQARKALTNVEIDYEKQGYLGAQHLIEQGCRRPACFRTIENRNRGVSEGGIGRPGSKSTNAC